VVPCTDKFDTLICWDWFLEDFMNVRLNIHMRHLVFWKNVACLLSLFVLNMEPVGRC